MPILKCGDISILMLSERITTPSLCLSKNGQTWYVPLFSGNKDSVVESDYYNYILGGLKVGSYRAAKDRSRKPPVKVTDEGQWIKLSSISEEALVRNLQLKLNNPNGGVMTVKVSWGKIVGGFSMNYKEITSLSKYTYSNGYITLPDFTVPYAGGMSGVRYALRFDVYETNGSFVGYTQLFIRRDI